MQRAMKYLSVFFVLVVALVVAGVAVLKSMDFNEYRGLIAEQVKAATGRDLVIAGELNLEISLNPALSVEGVTFANAAWGSRPEMAKLERLAAEVELIPLLSGEIHVKRLVLAGLDALLETDTRGRGNWEFAATEAAPGATPEAGEAGPLPVVKKVLIENVKLAYLDGASGERTTFVLDSLELNSDGPDSPLRLNIAGAFNTAAFSATGSLGSLNDLMGGAKPYPLKLSAKAFEVSLGIDGIISKPLDGKGLDLGLTVSVPDLVKTVKAAAAAVPALKDAGPIPPIGIDLSARATDIAGGYALSGIKLRLGGSDLSGDVSAVLSGPRPRIDAKLSSTLLGLDEFLPKDEGKPAPAEPAAAASKGDGRVFPGDPLALDGLKAVDAKVSLKAAKVVAKGMTVSDVHTELSLVNGRLEVKPFGLVVSGGRIGGTVLVDASKATPALNLTVKGDKIDFGKLLEQFQLTDIAKGTVGMDIAVRGRGKSVRRLMAGLDGKARIVVPGGRLESGALNIVSADLLNVFESKGDKDIRCAVVHFDIKKGMADARAIVFETGGISVVGTGSANLADETLKLRVDPRTKKVSVATVAMVPVDIGGTFAEPDFTIDKAGLAGNVISGAARTAGAVATLGLSLLVENAVKDTVMKTDENDYCGPALAGKKVVPGKMASAGSGAKPESSGTSATPPLEGAGKGIGGALEGAGKGIGGALEGVGKGIGGALEGVGKGIGGALEGLLGK